MKDYDSFVESKGSKLSYPLEEYKLNGRHHRLNKPAYIIYDDSLGYKRPLQLRYFIMGKLHREDGPAYIDFKDDIKYERYYLDGKEYAKEEWEKEILIRKLAGVK